MANPEYSSGDYLADRRADYAAMLAEGGDLEAAGDLMADALALAPRWAAGWFRLAEWRERAGRRADAVAAYNAAAAADPRDRLGARLKLELLGEGRAPYPSAFSEALFDQYADRFDDALVGKLAYRAPQLLAEALERHGLLPVRRCLDLGCGTGLMGERLRARVDWLAGMDISAAMLLKAAGKGVYDSLAKADLVEGNFGADYDLLTAADVLMYIGALDGFFENAAAALSSGGVLAFTVERHKTPEAFALGESRRYAHGEDLVVAGLRRCGFDIVSLGRETIRKDRDAPVDGLIVLARRA